MVLLIFYGGFSVFWKDLEEDGGSWRRMVEVGGGWWKLEEDGGNWKILENGRKEKKKTKKKK